MVLGFLVAVATVGWLIGGHVSNLTWSWGAEGERHTAAELDRLAAEWHVVHDIADGRGNWDHVAIGPPGVFVIDTKTYARESRVAGDALRVGRIRTDGAVFRGSAVRLKEILERETVVAVWVQAVVAIWGDFPQSVVEENRVVYVEANRIRDWLESARPRLSGELQTRLVAAAMRVGQ